MLVDTRPVRIVIVEDSAPDVLLVGESLLAEDIAHELIHFSDGMQAIVGLCRTECKPLPDLIVLDINIPKANGLEVLEKVKQCKYLEKVPVAMLTSSLAPEERARAERLGVDRYMRKPADLFEFLSEVGGTLRDLLHRP